MDALNVSIASVNTTNALTSSSSKIKTTPSKSSHTSTTLSPPLQSAPASSGRISTEESTATITNNAVSAATNIEPPLSSPTHSSSTSRATSCSPHTRLRVATPDSNTAAVAATAAGDCGGGLEMSGVSVASQLSAALDMKTKTSSSAVAAAVTAAAAVAAVELLHAGQPTSQKIKKYTCVDFADYKNNNSNENVIDSTSKVSCEQRIVSPIITTTTTTTMTCPKTSLRGFRRRGRPRLQQFNQTQQQQQQPRVEQHWSEPQNSMSLPSHQKPLQQPKPQQYSKRYRQNKKQQYHHPYQQKNLHRPKQQQQQNKPKKYSYYLDKKLCRLAQERKFAEAEKLQQQQQQLYASTKENFLLTLDLLAVVRRNASDKLRLIQMVHDNPILWDSRLPNFKGAEEEKNRAWEMIGKEFNAPGRRVARAFKSLRESYRRELAHVKLMGNGFKPKWSLYDAMDFLRDVIRERKGGSHAAEQAAIGLNLSAFSQHLNNNNNNSKAALKLSAMHSSFNESALNLSKCSPGLNMSHEDYYYYVKPELDMAAAAAAAAAAVHAGSNGIGSAGVGHPAMPTHPLPAHQSQQPHHHQQPQQQQQHLTHNASAHDSRVSSTRNDSNTQHSTTFDDLDASSVRSGDEASMRNADMSNQGSDEVEELEAIDADFPYPLILDANSPRSMSAAGGNSVGGGGAGGGASKRKRRDLNGDAMDGTTADDEDDYEGQMMQQHRHLRQQNGGSVGGGGGVGGNGGSGLGGMGCMLDMPQPQTVREVLNSKFCGFISAKLNSMEDTEADNLMNKILMLLVQSQTQTPAQASECK